MKKYVMIIMIVFSMVISYGAYASEKTVKNDPLKEKLEIVKSRICDTDYYTDFNSSSYGNDSVNYNFCWQNQDKDDFLEVTINSKNIITYYYRSYDDEKNHKPSLNHKPKDEIIEAAKKAVYTLNPDLTGKLLFETDEYKDMYATQYHVDIYRTENSIKITKDTGYITLSKDLLEIRSFNLNYTVINEFDDPSDIVSKDTAAKEYRNNLGYKLCYDIVYEDSLKKAVLKYVPDYNTNAYIYALDGSIFDYDKYIESVFEDSLLADKSINNAKSAGSSSSAFSDAELLEIEKIENLMPREIAEQSIRSNKYIGVDKNDELKNVRLSRDYYFKDKYIYYFTFESENLYCYVSCNAKTGEILTINRYSDDDYNKNSKIPSSEIEKYAKEAVQALAGSYFTNDEKNTFKWQENSDKTPTFEAKRIVNGVECLNNGLTVTVNEFDGKIQYYSLSNSDIEFPDSNLAIPVNDAYDYLFENCNYLPVYLPVVDENENTKAKLIYDFDVYNIELDAIKGKFFVEDLPEEKIVDYTDIAGHYAEDIIDELKEFGVGFTGGECKPDATIKQGEFVTLLSYIFYRNTRPVIYKTGFNFDSAYSVVKTYNWISEEEIDSQADLSREDACIILVKAMGNGDIAKYDEIYISPFRDVAENKGYIAILNAMGVVSGDGNGSFNPDENLTRADAMIIIHNYLSK